MQTTFVNAAIFGEFGNLGEPPLVVELDRVEQAGEGTTRRCTPFLARTRVRKRHQHKK